VPSINANAYLSRIINEISDTVLKEDDLPDLPPRRFSISHKLYNRRAVLELSIPISEITPAIF
jgi:hypothetical protein